MQDDPSSPSPAPAPLPLSPLRRLAAALGRLARNNWKVLVYVLLIVLCVLFAPEEPMKFIYTEF
jgi:hypothetical protein